MCRLLFAFAAVKIKNNLGDQLPYLEHTHVDPDDLIKTVKSYGGLAYNDSRRGKRRGFNAYDLLVYAGMLNKLNDIDLVLPPAFYDQLYRDYESDYMDEILYDWYPDSDRKIFAKKVDKPRKIIMICRMSDGQTTIFLCRHEDIVKPQGAMRPWTRSYRELPKKSRFRVSVDGQLLRRNVTKTPFSRYSCQFVDASMKANFQLEDVASFKSRYKKTLKLRPALVVKQARLLCTLFTKIFRGSRYNWAFNCDTVANLFLRKPREGNSGDTALYALLHARAFCDDLPLFCGKYNVFDAYTVLDWEIQKRKLIDFRALSFSLNPWFIYEYLQEYGYKRQKAIANKFVIKYPDPKNVPYPKIDWYSTYPHNENPTRSEREANAMFHEDLNMVGMRERIRMMSSDDNTMIFGKPNPLVGKRGVRLSPKRLAAAIMEYREYLWSNKPWQLPDMRKVEQRVQAAADEAAAAEDPEDFSVPPPAQRPPSGLDPSDLRLLDASTQYDTLSTTDRRLASASTQYPSAVPPSDSDPLPGPVVMEGDRPQLRGARLDYRLANIYGETVPRGGHNGGPAPDFQAIGLERNRIQHNTDVYVPNNMNPPDAVRFVWDNGDGTRTVINWVLGVN